MQDTVSRVLLTKPQRSMRYVTVKCEQLAFGNTQIPFPPKPTAERRNRTFIKPQRLIVAFRRSLDMRASVN